jgi:hypothetical protein
MRRAGHVARIEMTTTSKIFNEKAERKRSLGRPRLRWEDIKPDLKQIGCDDVDWVQVAQNSVRCWALVNIAIRLRVPLHARNDFTS